MRDGIFQFKASIINIATILSLQDHQKHTKMDERRKEKLKTFKWGARVSKGLIRLMNAKYDKTLGVNVP